MSEEKTFFQRLYEAMEGSSWSIQVTATKGRLVMTLSPIVGKENVSPIQLSGTPEDFDNEFFAQLDRPFQSTGFIIQGLNEMDESLKKIQEAKAKEASSKKPAPPANQTKKPDEKPKTATPPPAPDMFEEQAPAVTVEETTTTDPPEDPETDPDVDPDGETGDEYPIEDPNPEEPALEPEPEPEEEQKPTEIPTPSFDLDDL